MGEMFALFYLVPILAGVFLTIIWIVLPFAVFGIKGKLDGVNSRLSMTIWKLNRIVELLERKEAAETASDERVQESDIPDEGPHL